MINGVNADKTVTQRYEIEKSSATIMAEEFNRLWAEANTATQNMRDIIEELLLNQGKSFKDVLSRKEGLIATGDTSATTQQVISEYGMQTVSDRIVASAKAISKMIVQRYMTK